MSGPTAGEVGYLLTARVSGAKRQHIPVLVCADVVQAEALKANMLAKIRAQHAEDKVGVDVTEVLLVGFTAAPTVVLDEATLRAINLSLGW